MNHLSNINVDPMKFAKSISDENNKLRLRFFSSCSAKTLFLPNRFFNRTSYLNFLPNFYLTIYGCSIRIYNSKLKPQNACAPIFCLT